MLFHCLEYTFASIRHTRYTKNQKMQKSNCGSLKFRSEDQILLPMKRTFSFLLIFLLLCVFSDLVMLRITASFACQHATVSESVSRYFRVFESFWHYFSSNDFRLCPLSVTITQKRGTRRTTTPPRWMPKKIESRPFFYSTQSISRRRNIGNLPDNWRNFGPI